MKFMHLGQGLYVQNNVMGIHLRCSKCVGYEDSGETASHFDVQMDFSEIHVLFCLNTYLLWLILKIAWFFVYLMISFPFLLQLVREGNSSILEILKVAVIGSIDIPVQVSSFFFFFSFSCVLFGISLPCSIASYKAPKRLEAWT